MNKGKIEESSRWMYCIAIHKRIYQKLIEAIPKGES
jgi:hypothetical protein